MKSVFKKIRLPRKVMFVIAGVLVLGGASGAFAVYSGKEAFMGAAVPGAPSLSGLSCTVIETLKMRRNGQRWIRKYVSTETADGLDRVRTALRIAGLLVKKEKADLYQVVVLDHAGPPDRAERRGPAIGAEVLFAPDPARLPGMTASFVARYNDGAANTVGLFYGRQIALSPEDIKNTLTSMDDQSDCAEPPIAEGEAGAEGSEAGAHGEEKGGEEASGHDTAPEHGDDTAAPEHGEEAPAGHGVVKAEERSFFGSMIAMVLGGDEKPADHPEPAASGHGQEDGAVLPALDPARHDASTTSEYEKPPAEADGPEKSAEAH